MSSLVRRLGELGLRPGLEEALVESDEDALAEDLDRGQPDGVRRSPTEARPRRRPCSRRSRDDPGEAGQCPNLTKPTNSRDLGDDLRDAAVDEIDLLAQELVARLDGPLTAYQRGVLLGPQFTIGRCRLGRCRIPPPVDGAHEVVGSAPFRRAEAAGDVLGGGIRVGVVHPNGDEGVGDVRHRGDRDRRPLNREPDVGRTTLERAQLLVARRLVGARARGGSRSSA